MSKANVEITERDEQIEYIMENYYYTDDVKFKERNLLYLQGLDDIELELLYNKVK